MVNIAYIAYCYIESLHFEKKTFFGNFTPKTSLKRPFFYANSSRLSIGAGVWILPQQQSPQAPLLCSCPGCLCPVLCFVCVSMNYAFCFFLLCVELSSGAWDRPRASPPPAPPPLRSSFGSLSLLISMFKQTPLYRLRRHQIRPEKILGWLILLI